MKELKNIILIALISAAAGTAVSIPVSFIDGSSLSQGMLRGAAAGAVIGFAARFAFTALYLKLRHTPLPAYAAMTGTVAAGTLLACLLTGITIMPAGLTAIGVSVAVGLLLTRLIFSYSKKLNDGLADKQNRLSNPGSR